MVNVTGTLFEVEEPALARPRRGVPNPQVEASQDDLTATAGVALWGPLLDRVGLVEVTDRVGLRKVGPGGYTGGECLRALVETMLAGGDFLTDVDLLRDPATTALRGGRALPSHDTLWRFVNDADIGTVGRAAGVNRVLLSRQVTLGVLAGDDLEDTFDAGVFTVDPDATRVATYGKAKQGSTFSYNYAGTCLHPIVGVIGETGHALAIRTRGGAASPARGLASFTRTCLNAVPNQIAAGRQAWVRIDSAGYQNATVEICERADAWFSITARKHANVRAAIEAVAVDDDTVWVAAAGHEGQVGSQVCDTTLAGLGRDLRLIVRRQPAGADGDAQLSLDDVDGWRFHAIITNIDPDVRSAVDIEAHHRNRGGIPEDAIRQLKNHFGFNHAPLAAFQANALWQQACLAAYNIALWLRHHALPDAFTRVRGKRLRLAFLNVAARIGHHGRRLQLKFSRGYRWVDDFAAALRRLHALPAFG